MTVKKYDPSEPYLCIDYHHVSSGQQNRRSPDQQAAEIARVTARWYPWALLTAYRDDAKTGRLVGRRPALQRMLRDIEAGLVKPDLVYVDTLERLGRADEIVDIRRKL